MTEKAIRSEFSRRIADRIIADIECGRTVDAAIQFTLLDEAAAPSSVAKWQPGTGVVSRAPAFSHNGRLPE